MIVNLNNGFCLIGNISKNYNPKNDLFPKFNWEIKKGNESLGFTTNIHYAMHLALLHSNPSFATQYEKDVVIPKEQKRMRAKIEQEFLNAKPKRKEKLLSLFPYLRAL